MTCGHEAEAAKIAETLVRERLAACANYWPIRSVYHWRGKLVKGREQILLLKSLRGKLPQLIKRIKTLHCYQLPAIWHWGTEAEKKFGAWLEHEVKTIKKRKK